MYILATDYDGSLRLDAQVSAEAIQKIKEFQNAGHVFGIVTGRPVAGLLPILQNEEIPFDFIIASTGAIVLDKDGNPLRKRSFPREVADHFYQRIASEEIKRDILEKYATENGEQTLHMQANAVSGDFAYHVLGRMHLDSGIKFNNAIEAIDWEQIHSFFGIQAKTEDGKSYTPVLYDILQEELGEEMSIYLNIRNIDIAPKGVNKATALEWLAEHNSWDKGDIYTFGDGLNDLGMLQAFHGAAITSGTAPLLEQIATQYPSIEAYIDAILQQ